MIYQNDSNFFKGSHEDDVKRMLPNGIDIKSSIKTQAVAMPITKYIKLPMADKENVEIELREYKDKERSKLRCMNAFAFDSKNFLDSKIILIRFTDRNRADRDIMYESIEEVAETHDEVS